MKRFYSLLLLSVFLFFLITESSTYHYHVDIIEKGIVETPEKENECIICLISSNTSSEFKSFEKNGNDHFIPKESLFNVVNSVYNKLANLNLSSRGPPITLL
jgi:hypothetical protein|tara:strand:+ start:197 stop:502 length:306 start_codon:yes stop_codon:yes gene_type:complete